MTDKLAETVLTSIYGDATRELTDLVMAAESAFDSFGKISIFGRNKGKEAEEKFTRALVKAIIALQRVGMIKDVNDAEESFTALQRAMTAVRRAYPTWPRAYRYWDDFYARTYGD